MYTYVSNEIIDGQLRVVYMLLKKEEYNLVSKVINDIINNIRFAYISDTNKKTLGFLIDESYKALVDLAFKRYRNVHDKVRNMHFALLRAY